jgi:uncharacterized protein YcnI
MPVMQRLILAVALAMVATGAGAASAHVELKTAKAPAGSTYEAVFQVEHGCAGSPTVRLRVVIPEGVSEVAAEPKPGWQVSTVDAAGMPAIESVHEVAWSGGPLPAKKHDSFAMKVRLPDAPGTDLYFPVIQECEKGTTRWIEIPEAGKSEADYEDPAPHVSLTPKAQ